MFRDFFGSGSWFDLPLIAMALFVAIFLTVVLRVFQRARRGEYERMASLPLEDGHSDAKELQES
jgi:cbb3-type cytochrome oxidase subunit 3